MNEAALPEPGVDAPRLDAEAILAAELPLALRGYRIAEVDALLGELAQQVAASDAELARLRALAGGADADAFPAAITAASPPVGPDAVPIGAEPVQDVAPDADRSADASPDLAGVATDGDPEDGSDGDAGEGSDGERPREVTVVATGARRRALVPSVLLTLGAIAALVIGWQDGDEAAVIASIAASGLALVGVAVAVVVTRSRRSG